MPVVRLKGLNRNTKVLADGRRVTYWYAWKGGPSLEGEPGTPEFTASYNRAVAARKTPRDETLASIVVAYKKSPEWRNKTAESTKRHWSPWLDRISRDTDELDIGGLTFDMLEDKRCRKDILEWRDQWAATPRKADYAMQVLCRVLNFGVDRGMLSHNVASRVSQLYDADRADQIWTDDEIARYVAAAPSVEIGFIVQLACLTGLRREDLAKLEWSQVGDIAIVIETGKSRGRKTATVPLVPETVSLLAAIKARQGFRYAQLVASYLHRGKPPPEPCATVLSTAKTGRPWSVSGLEHQVIDTKTKAGIDKHLHDGRGTFGTFLRKNGLTAPEIADVLGWEEDRVKRLLAKYVDRDSIVRDIAARLAKNKPGAKTPN